VAVRARRLRSPYRVCSLPAALPCALQPRHIPPMRSNYTHRTAPPHSPASQLLTLGCWDAVAARSPAARSPAARSPLRVVRCEETGRPLFTVNCMGEVTGPVRRMREGRNRATTFHSQLYGPPGSEVRPQTGSYLITIHISVVFSGKCGDSRGSTGVNCIYQ
jgi:hypothetical protein